MLITFLFYSAMHSKPIYADVFVVLMVIKGTSKVSPRSPILKYYFQLLNHIFQFSD